MKTYKLPYGVGLVFSSISGLHFFVNEQYAYRPDRVISKITTSDFMKEMCSNELSNISPVTFEPGKLYIVATTKFDALFKRDL